eukprot:EG_transcript_12678
MFWSIGPLTQSLWCLFRFRDGVLEQKYAEQSRAYYMHPARVHFYVRIVFNLIDAVSFFPLTEDTFPFFMAYVALAGLAALCLALSHGSLTVRHHALLFHCAFCCCVMVATSCLNPLLTEMDIRVLARYWLPPGGHLLLSTAQGSTAMMDAEFRAMFSAKYARSVFRTALINTTLPWTILAVNGLNPLTLFTQAFTTAALVVSIVLTPYFPPINLAFNLFTLASCALSYLALSIVIERFRRVAFLADRLLEQELHTSQTADNILNHTLKNTLADVAGIIEMYLAGAHDRSTLEDAITSLRRGMKSCRQRQVYLKLVAGEYTPVLNEVRLKEFGESLLAGRAVRGQFPDLTVYLDQMLCSLILENALSNAFKHGDPRSPDVEFTIAVEPSPLPRSASNPRTETDARVTLTVSNAADPLAAPLTEERAAQLLSGQAAAAAQPREVRPVLSDRLG